MRVWLINDRPEHAVLVEAIALLRRAHDVVEVNPRDPSDLFSAVEALAGQEPGMPDVVLLKSHDPAAVTLGRQALAAGALVVNSPEATRACLDRDQMARIAAGAGIPFPATSVPMPLRDLDLRNLARGPLVIKSRRSRRGDLVARADDADRIAVLVAERPDEEVVVQPMLSGDGWDHKIWVVGDEVFYGRRRSPLDGAPAARDGGETVALTAADLPRGWEQLAREVGAAYGLRVFGLDLLATPTGPVAIDVNPFPGCRGVTGAARGIAAFVDRLMERVR